MSHRRNHAPRRGDPFPRPTRRAAAAAPVEPCDVAPDPAWPPTLGRSAEARDLAPRPEPPLRELGRAVRTRAAAAGDAA
jgi:hypothetical protein